MALTDKLTAIAEAIRQKTGGTNNMTLDEMVTEISNIGTDVDKTLTGDTTYTMTDSVNYPLFELNLYGRSTQNGIPTPETPVDIVSVGDSGGIEINTCGKNLVPRFKTTASGSVTYTVNEDGSISAFSDDEANTSREIEVRTILPKGNYVISGAPEDSAVGKNDIYVWNVNESKTIARSYTNSKMTKFSLATSTSVIIKVRTGAGKINCKFYPQIEIGTEATDYEPYKGNTASIATNALPLCGIQVESGGNYTDSMGQSWVCDELIYYAYGPGSIIKRTAKIDSYNGESITTPYISTTGALTTGATVIYQTDAPQEIALTAADVSALMQLRTYIGVTNISNSGNAEMTVRYCTNKTVSEYTLPIIENLQKQINDIISSEAVTTNALQQTDEVDT